MKDVAPGRRTCCIYHVEIDTSLATSEPHAWVEEDPGGRRRVAGLDWTGEALGVAAWVATGSEPEGGGRLDGSLLPDDTAVGAWSDVGAPVGLPPEIAFHLRLDETTTVAVKLTSKCLDHEHEYDGKTESVIELSAGRQCTNEVPDDRCDVRLRAMGTGAANVSGDLDLGVDCAIGGDVDELPEDGPRVRDPHDHRRDGERSTWQDDDGVDDPPAAAAFTWSATFRNQVELDAAQIVPVTAHPTTDVVLTRTGGRARHALALDGKTVDRSCEGSECGCGATNCTCEPSFSLVINAEKQELAVPGGRPWSLSRGSDGTGPWTAS